MFNILGSQYEDEVKGFSDAQASFNIPWMLQWEIWIRDIRLHRILEFQSKEEPQQLSNSIC